MMPNGWRSPAGRTLRDKVPVTKRVMSIKQLYGDSLDALSGLPYWRGKGHLVLSLLKGAGSPFAARMPYNSLIRIGTDAMRQTILPYWIGQYERAMISEFRRALANLEPGDAVADVGANLGFYTVLAAGFLRSHPHSQVYAFEPNPVVYAELCQNIELNHFENVVAFPQAVAAEHGMLELSGREKGVTFGSLRPARSDETPGIPVPVVTLDELNFEPRIGIIKLDIEGAELFALEGARGIVERDRPILFYEEYERAYADFGYGVRDVRDFLLAREYELFALRETNSSQLNLTRNTQNGRSQSSYGNVLAVPREKKWNWSAL